MSQRLALLAVCSSALLAAGCTGATDVSPEITKAQVEADHARAVKNIDNDPHLTDKQKQSFKEHLGLAGPGAKRGPTGPPPGAK